MSADAEMAVMKAEFELLKHEVAAMRADIKGLVTAWEAGSNLVKLVKWTAAVGAGFSAMWAIITNSIHHP